jgi:O-antigen/teichoic acid export membrane protein
MASAVILLPFYTSYLTTSDFGALAIYTSLALLIQILTTYSFDTSLYIHFHEYKSNPQKLSSFVSSAFLLMIGIGVAVGVALSIVGDVILDNVFTSASVEFYPYGLLSAVTGIFQALFKVNTNLLQSRERPEMYFWSNMVSFLLIVVFTIVGMKLYPNTLVGPVGGRTLAAVISGSWAIGRIFKEFGVHFNYPLLRSTFAFNFYTFIYQLLQWVVNYFDRILMAFFLSLQVIGTYHFAMQCMVVVEFILNGLHNSFYPKVVSTVMAQKEKKSSPEINRYYHGFTSVIMLLICLCILGFPIAIELFSQKKDYQLAIQYIPYIGLLYIFRTMRLYFAVPYAILKYTKPLPKIYLIISVVKVGLILLLAERFSVYGVLAAAFISSVVEILLLTKKIKNSFQFEFNKFKIVIAPVMLAVLILVLEPLLGRTYPTTVHFVYLFCCTTMLWWFYRNEIKLIDPLKILR